MYCTDQEVRDIATQFTENKIETGVLESVIERASRMFDLTCGVEPGYFEAAQEGVAASTKVLYGNGTNYLKLPPYVAGSLSTTITVPTGFTAQEFTEKDGYLIRSTNGLLPSSPCGSIWRSGWIDGAPITVTAIWGYEFTPEDVKAAIIELTINLVRETDPAEVKLVNLEGQPLREKLPPRVAEIARRYRVRGGNFV